MIAGVWPGGWNVAEVNPTAVELTVMVSNWNGTRVPSFVQPPGAALTAPPHEAKANRNNRARFISFLLKADPRLDRCGRSEYKSLHSFGCESL
jgi:hypothetical protein